MEKIEKHILSAVSSGIFGYLLAGSASILAGATFNYLLAFIGFFGGMIIGYFLFYDK